MTELGIVGIVFGSGFQKESMFYVISIQASLALNSFSSLGPSFLTLTVARV